MGGKTLIYFTNNYPLGGTTEEAFMKSEIVTLSQAFSRVIVVPQHKGSDCLDISFWPENVSLDTRLTEEIREQGKLRYLCLLNPVFAVAAFRDGRVFRSRYLLNYLIQSFQEGLAIKNYCKKLFRRGEQKIKETVFYSFWFADASIGLGLMPKKMVTRWVSRAHRYDLYDDCVPVRSKVFREMAFKNLDKVLACSNQGADYLSCHYPRWKEKIGTLYLGTSQPVSIPDYKANPSIVKFLTIARLEPVKRPLQTFKILNEIAVKYPQKKFSWTVIGGGSLEEQLHILAADEAIDNFEVQFLGEKHNPEVHKLLCEQSFDWMIMLSESEGLPISFAEAMSYGIPAIATDVGGVKEEVINGESGILLSSNPSADELASAIAPYFSEEKLYLDLRGKTLDFWKKYLNEKVLKQALADILSC